MNATLPDTPYAASLHGVPLAQPTVREAGPVSWGAIVAGAAGAAALSMILLILGTGLGLSSVSPFSGQGLDAAAFGLSTIAWLTFTQLAASGMGGYLSGRLRSRWLGTHVDEVYFRDTAHGFLAWAVATLVTAALLGSAIGSIVGGAAQAGASVVGGGAAAAAVAAAPASGAANAGDSMAGRMQDRTGNSAYFVDTLFRRDMSAAPGSTTGTLPAALPTRSGADDARLNAEMARLIANAARTGTLSAEDTRYAGQLVAQQTGLSQADAEKRVSDGFARVQAQAKEAENTARLAADKARKASSYAALWLFVSLLAGAFIASLAATFGGRRRDL